MKKAFLGNNCGILYKDNESRLLLLSVTPHVFEKGDPIKVYSDDKWHNGRVEFNEKEFNGYYFHNESDSENHMELKTGMKIKHFKETQKD